MREGYRGTEGSLALHAPQPPGGNGRSVHPRRVCAARERPQLRPPGFLVEPPPPPLASTPTANPARFVTLYERLCWRMTPEQAAAEALRLGFYRAGPDEAAVFLHRDAAPGGVVLIRGGPEIYVLTLQDVPSLGGRSARERQCVLGAEVLEEQARSPFLALMQGFAAEGLTVGTPRRLDLPGASPQSLAVSVNGPAPRSRLALLGPQTNRGNIIRSVLMAVE